MGAFSVPTENFCQFVAKLATGKNYVEVKTTEGSKVKGSWNSTRQLVKLGSYEISGPEFGIFADYIFNGGWGGWNSDKPGFVEEAVNFVLKNMSTTESSNSYLAIARQKQLPTLEDKLKIQP